MNDSPAVVPVDEHFFIPTGTRNPPPLAGGADNNRELSKRPTSLDPACLCARFLLESSSARAYGEEPAPTSGVSSVRFSARTTTEGGLSAEELPSAECGRSSNSRTIAKYDSDECITPKIHQREDLASHDDQSGYGEKWGGAAADAYSTLCALASAGTAWDRRRR